MPIPDPPSKKAQKKYARMLRKEYRGVIMAPKPFQVAIKKAAVFTEPADGGVERYNKDALLAIQKTAEYEIGRLLYLANMNSIFARGGRKKSRNQTISHTDIKQATIMCHSCPNLISSFGHNYKYVPAPRTAKQIARNLAAKAKRKAKKSGKAK